MLISQKKLAGIGLTIGLGEEGLSVHCAEGSHFIGQGFIFFKFVVHLCFLLYLLCYLYLLLTVSCFTQFIILNSISLSSLLVSLMKLMTKHGKQIQTTAENPSQFPRNIPDIRFGDSETSESGNLGKDQLCYIHLDV